ncbi:hypothetical protein INP30_13630, partial [Staphylococcus aureus]|nr:hypothetical protein [Staphylococcus aureus]
AKRYTDLPMLVMVEGEGRELRAGRFLRASDLTGNLEQDNNPEWKTVAINQHGELVSPQGSIGYRWGDAERADKGKWNLEARDGSTGAEIDLA